MYAHVTSTHEPMPEQLAEVVVPRNGHVSCHLSGTLYLSFRPEEAERLAAALFAAAAKARAEAASEAPC